MGKCEICGKLRRFGQACACAAVLLSHEPHVEPRPVEARPVQAAASVVSSTRTAAGGFTLVAEAGHYVLKGFSSGLSTG